jgi:hypothetical protein
MFRFEQVFLLSHKRDGSNSSRQSYQPRNQLLIVIFFLFVSRDFHRVHTVRVTRKRIYPFAQICKPGVHVSIIPIHETIVDSFEMQFDFSKARQCREHFDEPSRKAIWHIWRDDQKIGAFPWKIGQTILSNQFSPRRLRRLGRTSSVDRNNMKTRLEILQKTFFNMSFAWHPLNSLAWTIDSLWQLRTRSLSSVFSFSHETSISKWFRVIW